MLILKGSWGDRLETAKTCTERLQRSWESMPPDPEAYGPWRARDYTAGNVMPAPLVPVAIENPTVVERCVLSETEAVNGGPRSVPGFYIEFSRESLVERYTDGGRNDAAIAQYKLRAGFINRPRPHNHLLFNVNAITDPDAIRAYFTALIHAWKPDHLAVVSFDIIKAQGRRTPQLDIGWLTYFRDGIELDTAVLDKSIAVNHQDGGHYLTLNGTPEHPDLGQIVNVRHALGYA